MRALIGNDPKKCMGCNRCIRVCPIDEANVVCVENGAIKVHIDSKKCIACGACLIACQHGSRFFFDDTERFFNDLAAGMDISILCAPAIRSNLENWPRILTLLKQNGVRAIYDVSLGADICTWAHIRWIQKNDTTALITQPCPAIVDYILLYRPELLSFLSPIHSPMLCTAIYMRKYQGVTGRLAAISPCIAKANEFDETGGLVSYNVTFSKLDEYINRHHLLLPAQESGFDHHNSALGSIYSMPGGLKENVEAMIGKDLRIDKGEGQSVIYGLLDTFAKENEAFLPAIFDVLNCSEGCNLGTGCRHNKSVFQVNASMDKARHKAMQDYSQNALEELYRHFDQTLKLEDFVRHYQAKPVHAIEVSETEIEKSFIKLGKRDAISRSFNCGACGSKSCRKMAVNIAKKVNIPENCIQKANADMREKHDAVMQWRAQNAEAVQSIKHDISDIKDFSDRIVGNISAVGEVINTYDSLAQEINRIADNIHIISINARIEAARAGEQGRAFAVVAEAVRSLAGETKSATLNITKASSDAQKTLGGISDMVLSVNKAIAQSCDKVNRIDTSTRDVLEE